MADERCVYPEGEPLTPGQWLDLETAELLLRGESPEAVDPAVRDQADRLAKTLESLTAQPARPGVELPGEEAALAAFRKVRADRADDWVGPLAEARHRDAHDAGLVRIGRPGPPAPPRRRRPVPAHFGLAAALVVAMVGVGAVVVATGVVPSPSGGDESSPAASVSAPATPERPQDSPSPTELESKPSTDGKDAGGLGSRDTARGSTGTDPGTGDGPRGELPAGQWSGAAAACRDLWAGKGLSADRRRSLEDAAGGSTRVWKYCRGVLKDGGTGTGTGTGTDDRNAPGGAGDQGENGDGGKGDESGQDNGSGDGGGHFMAPRKNRHNPDGGTSETPVDQATALRPPAAATPSPEPTSAPTPEPTYSAV